MFWGLGGNGASRRLAKARQAGVGLYVQEWKADGGPALLEAVVEWCRDTIGRSRRPYGLDRFDVAVAYRALDGTVCGSRRFSRLQPLELYDGEQGLASRLRSLLSTDGGAPVHVAVALYAWGDAVHASLGD